MKTKLFSLTLALVYSLLQSQYLANDSFENNALNTLPTGYNIKHSGTGVQNQKVVNTVVKNGSQSFQLEGANNWSANIYKTITFPTLVTTETFINIDLAANGISAGFGIGDFDAPSWGAKVSTIEFTATNGTREIVMTSFVNNNYGPRYLLISNYQTNTWYHLKIEHNLTTKKAKVYINGNLASGFYNGQNYTEFDIAPSLTPVHLQLFAGNAGMARAMFDDVKVYETSSLSVNDIQKNEGYLYLSESQNELILKNLKTPLKYNLYNASGKLIKKGNMKNTLDISELPKGVYIFTSSDESFSKKFLKTK